MKPKYTITQMFGANATPTYVAGGLKGHSGVDSDGGYGSMVQSYWNQEYVYKVLDVEHPASDGSGFTGVFTIVEQDGKCFEFLYGHLNPSVKVGSILTSGSVIGTQGNNGECYSNGIQITLEMQKNGDHRGTHRHDQARELRKDTLPKPNTRYIIDSNGSTCINGVYYAIPNYDNGYNGCFDWTKLDKELNSKETPFIKFQNALREFQVSEGITPYPLVGEKTKKALNKYQSIKY